MKSRVSIYILVIVIMIPQVAFASWWNPFSWNWIQSLFSSVEIQRQENTANVTSINSGVSTTTEDSSGVSTTTLKEPITPIATNQQKPKEPAVKPTVNKQSITTTVQTTPTATSSTKNTEVELLKQQNELLKKQLEAQQKIVENTMPVDGSCSTTLNICNSGTMGDITDTNTHYKWFCKGINGGSTSSCFLPIPVPDTVTTVTPTPPPPTQENFSYPNREISTQLGPFYSDFFNLKLLNSNSQQIKLPNRLQNSAISVSSSDYTVEQMGLVYISFSPQSSGIRNESGFWVMDSGEWKNFNVVIGNLENFKFEHGGTLKVSINDLGLQWVNNAENLDSPVSILGGLPLGTDRRLTNHPLNIIIRIDDTGHILRCTSKNPTLPADESCSKWEL